MARKPHKAKRHRRTDKKLRAERSGLLQKRKRARKRGQPSLAVALEGSPSGRLFFHCDDL